MSLDEKPQIGLLERRPAAPAVIALMIGVLTYNLLPVWPVVWISLLGLLIAGAIGFRHRSIVSTPLVLLAFGVLGLGLAQLEAFYYPRDDISAFATDDPRLAQVEIRIDDPPREITGVFDHGHFPPKQVFTGSIQRVKTWNGWIECHGRVLVQIAQPHPRLAQGQIIGTIGRLQRPAPSMNPGQFNWAAYYREQRILASLQIMHADNIDIISQGRVGPITWLREQARRLLARGFEPNDSLDHALLRALVLGDNDPELRDIQEQFRRTGTSHHLSISGMHVAVLGFVVFGLCRLLRFHPRISCWIGLISVLLYGIVALPSPPVVRSIALCSSFVIGALIRRKTDLVQLLCLSALGMLIYHPLDLFNAGFQLSFGIVLGLTLLTPTLLRAMPGRDKDVEIAQLTQWPGPYGRLQRTIKDRFRIVLSAGIVAWLIAMPLIAFHFEQLNPWAIPASLILAPFVFVALVGGFAKIILTLLWPSASGAWATLAVAPVAAMRHVVDWLATLPGSEVPMPAPPVWMVLLYYLLILTIWAPWRGIVLKWMARSASFAGCIFLAALPMRQGLASLHSEAGELKLTLLAIGAGQCAVLEPPDAPAVLFDAGSSSITDVLYQALGPFLRHEGRRDIQTIFISHPDYDHFSGVGEIVPAYDVNQVLISTEFRQQSFESPAAELLLNKLDTLERPPRQVQKGQSIDLGGGARVEILWPPPNATFTDHNDCSLVIRLNFAGKSILFTGDIQAPAERALLESQQNLKADVLVAPHHGSNESTTTAFVAAVSPSAIISSDDRTPTSKQRQFDRVMSGYRVLRTHTSGAITVRISKEGQVKVESYLHPRN